MSYRIRDLLGEGSFGYVYLADFRNTGRECALKTFRRLDQRVIDLFRREVALWIGLERHSCIVPAILVEQIHGRLFVATHYVKPDTRGRTSLRDYLQGEPIKVDKALQWAIQLCHGMEHASTHGIRAHLDLKPDNILIGHDGHAKITDFGLATTLDKCPSPVEPRLVDPFKGFGTGMIREKDRRICGTPGYIAPEVFRTGMGAADIRSDIYSFGLVLWQMANGRPESPFHVPGTLDAKAYSQRLYDLQISGPVPYVNSPFWPVIQKSLEVEPKRRYTGFAALRKDLEVLYTQLVGERPEIPPEMDRTGDYWNNLAISLESIERYDEALNAYDHALDMEPDSAHAWSNKGALLGRLRRYKEAMVCQNKALDIDAHFAYAWHGQGRVLVGLKRYHEAVKAFDRALEVDPAFSAALGAKGHALELAGLCEDALRCYKDVIEMDWINAEAFAGMGRCLHELDRLDEAIDCYSRAYEIKPQDTGTMFNRALAADQLGRRQDAIKWYNEFLAVAESKHNQQIKLAQERLRELKDTLYT